MINSYSKGHHKGLSEGRIQGIKIGDEQGFIRGNEEGYDLGYYKGINLGEDVGFKKGHTLGYDSGYSVGYENGKRDGYEGYVKGYEDGKRDGDAGYVRGYGNGYYAGLKLSNITNFEGWGTFIRDPTYSEAIAFIKADKTDEKNLDSCQDYTFQFKNNSYYVGYRCFWVYIEFESGFFAHAIVGFNTTDRGMIFIEPQNDCFVNLKRGISYWNVALKSKDEFLTLGDDTIKDYIIFW